MTVIVCLSILVLIQPYKYQWDAYRQLVFDEGNSTEFAKVYFGIL